MSNMRTSGRARRPALALALALALAVTLVPATAFAATVVTTPSELTAAFAAGGDVQLGGDIDAGELTQGSFFTIAGGKTVNLDLNGYTIEGTRVDGAIGAGNRNTSVLTNAGTLTISDTVGGGAIKIDAENNDGWNSATAAVSNTGTFTLLSGNMINLGGTDMAYGIDALSGAGTPVTLIAGGSVRSENYIGARLFANSVSKTNDFTITGGSVYGYTRGIWAQQPNTNSSLASIVVDGGRVEGETQAAIDVWMMGSAGGVVVEVNSGVLVNDSDTRPTIAIRHASGAAGAEAAVNGGQLMNSGAGGNLGTPEGSTILVTAGIFNAPVPAEYIDPAADPADIIDSASVVTADADVAYTVVITPSIDFGKLTRSMATQSRDFVVAVVDALIEHGKSVVVTNSTADMNMKDQDGAGSKTLPFLLTQGTFAFPQAELADGEASVGTEVTCEPSALQAAGSYRGFMTFEVSYE